ncbi:hypothetical protein D3C72_1912990 [compost metagenome]
MLVVLILPASIVPVILILVRPVRFVILALVILAVVAVKLVTLARLVIEFCAPSLNDPLNVPALIVPVAVMFWILARLVMLF